MRIAVLILGLVLGAFMFVQTLLGYVLGSATNNQAISTAGAVGLLVTLLWLVSCAVVSPLPLVSVAIFGVAGLLGFAISGDYPDMAYWGVASLILAMLSFFGWVGKRRAARQEREREARMIAGMRQSVASAVVAPTSAVYCDQCGEPGPATSRFCHACGAARAVAPVTAS